MIDILAIQYGMMQNIRSNFYPPHKTVIELYPGVNALFTNLFGRMDTIDNVNLDQSETSTGITIMKKQKKLLLVAYTYRVAAVGCLIVDEETRAIIDKSENQLKRMKDEDLLIKTKKIYDTLLPKLSEMLTYGIKQVDFDNLNTARTDFKYWEKKPHAKIKARSHYSDRQYKLISEEDEFINDKLDKAMNIFKVDKPGIFYDYLVQRRLPNPGVSFHEGLEIFIVDEVSKIAIEACEVEVPNEYINQLLPSDKKGRVYFDLIIEGDYILTIKKAGYQTYTATVNIKKGRRTIVNVLLKKI